MIAIASAALLLAGCAAGQRSGGSADPAFGESVRWNAAVQTIDPDPVYTAEDAQPGSSGAKGAEAVKRYRTDNIKDVRVLTTTSNSSSGSSEPQ
jgi:hypothetical protein